jgi:hypothetical protein
MLFGMTDHGEERYQDGRSRGAKGKVGSSGGYCFDCLINVSLE